MRRKKADYIETIRNFEVDQNNKVPPKVFFPENLEEIIALSENLIAKNNIIVNISNLSLSDRLRAIDFLSGVSFSLNAKRKLIENNIYLFAFSEC